MAQNYSITSSLGGDISITTYGNENISQKNCIILVHGFQGFKDWGYASYFSDYFANNGYFVITFNFSHNGIGKNKYEITEFEKFANNTLSREVTELKDVVNAYSNNFFGEINTPKVGLVGHSRGGAISLLASLKLENVKAIAVWGSVSTFDRYSERQKKRWREKGYYPIRDAQTKRELRLNLSLLQDFEKKKHDLLNIEKAVKRLSKPLLIIHGKEDLLVKVKEAEELYSWANKEIMELKIIENTGHTFGCEHPFKGTNDKFDLVLNSTLKFFDKHLVN